MIPALSSYRIANEMECVDPMRITVALSLAVALNASAAPVAVPSAPSAEALLAQIRNNGGDKVLGALWENRKSFSTVLGGIESADAEWLKVATALRPFADAGAAESIDYSVALALPKAPARILALVGHGFDVGFICTSPFIEPEPGIAEAYEKKTLSALASVHEPALAGLAVECASRVELQASP
jgi:hypothetical protein